MPLTPEQIDLLRVLAVQEERITYRTLNTHGLSAADRDRWADRRRLLLHTIVALDEMARDAARGEGR